MRSVPRAPDNPSSIRALEAEQRRGCASGPQGPPPAARRHRYIERHGQHHRRDDHPPGRVRRVLLRCSRCGNWPGAAARARPSAAAGAGRAISAFSLVDVLTVRVLVPTAAVGASLYAAGNGIGLIHYLNLRLSVAALIGFLALDLAIYAAARRVPQGAGAVAAAPHAPRRSRHRRHHRRALPSDRDPDLARHQDRGDPGARHSGGRGDPVRGRAQRHLDVQPFQRVDAGAGSTACCASSW